jgi:hypothetical protein
MKKYTKPEATKVSFGAVLGLKV